MRKSWTEEYCMRESVRNERYEKDMRSERRYRKGRERNEVNERSYTAEECCRRKDATVRVCRAVTEYRGMRYCNVWNKDVRGIRCLQK